jgi:NAD(P)-dependent dehydrogenase (short-subunit alcohol dehydrogenase family)
MNPKTARTSTTAQDSPWSAADVPRLDGRVAVITGANTGIGFETARVLAGHGARVVLACRSVERARAAAARIAASAVAAPEILELDLASLSSVRRAAEQLRELHPVIDLLINNAAQDPWVRLADIDEGDFRHTFDVNFFAPVAATLAVQGAMAERGRGIIVNVSSDGGRLPSPGPGAYPSSKAALTAFSESLSFRLGPKGVHVHVVYPAFMATELGLGALERGLRQPPRPMTRSVESVSRRILARAGGASLEISVSGLIDAAMVFRYALPRPYHRLRRNW